MMSPADDPLVPLDELYSVSDLHLGGAPGFQIFNQGRELAALIDLLTERPPDRELALVLNGDIVDFLAEDGASYFSPDRAVAMLDRIARDPAFAPVFQALSRFTRTPRRLLVLALGNHDVELALPAVQEYLLGALCGDDAAARARVRFAMSGGGFGCQIGRARVFCSHGNEVDTWNLIDYEALGRVIKAQRDGRRAPDWQPNAGTQLVIDVMNGIKKNYPFVDLLKPETSVVPKMLLAMQPSLLSRLKAMGPILLTKARASLRTGRLSGPSESDEDKERLDAEVNELLFGSRWQNPLSSAESSQEVLRQMEEDFRSGLHPMRLVSQSAQPEMLGLPKLVLDKIMGRSLEDSLRDALKDWLKDDKTFPLTTEDETYKRLDADVPPGVDFVLAGHTHLARALPRKNGSGMYFNSGTWIRLIQLRPEVLQSAAAFAPTFRALTNGKIEALDQVPGLVLLRPTVVRIAAEGGATAGELMCVAVDGGRASLIAETGTRFTRS